MEVIGYKQNDFTSTDGTAIKGVNLYCTYPVGKSGTGYACERIYVSDAKMAASGYTPKLGDKINVLYNKFGKVAGITRA